MTIAGLNPCTSSTAAFRRCRASMEAASFVIARLFDLRHDSPQRRQVSSQGETISCTLCCNTSNGLAISVGRSPRFWHEHRLDCSVGLQLGVNDSRGEEGHLFTKRVIMALLQAISVNEEMTSRTNRCLAESGIAGLFRKLE